MPIIKKGDKFGRLTAIEFNHRNKWSEQFWIFRCDCGVERIIKVNNVKNGNTKSCGCLLKKIGANGMGKTKIYFCWYSMIQRCLNKNCKDYKDYGGRGITVCDEWLTFKNFYKDMGKHPQGKSLDRINNDGNYCPKNCKWSTPKEQQNNTRNNRLITFNGKTQTMKQWSEELKINYYVIRYRLKSGWSMEKIAGN